MGVAYLTPARRRVVEYAKKEGVVRWWPCEVGSLRLIKTMTKEGWLEATATGDWKPIEYRITAKTLSALETHHGGHS